MEQWWSIRKSRILPALVLAVPVWAAPLEVPADTRIEIRLKTKVSTVNARADDPVEAVVIAPVMVGAQYAIPAGAAVHGVVGKAVHPEAADQRAALLLTFTGIEIGGTPLKIAARVVTVDNAREKIDETGQVNGILPSETITGKLDSGIGKLADKYAGLAGILSAAKSAVLKSAESDIVYDAGVEMELRLTAPLSLAKTGGAGPADSLVPVEDLAALQNLIAGQPFQTMAQQPAKPSDVTNILLVGTRQQVEETFAAAGWTTAAALTREAKFETLRALAEDRGYNEAPVSVLLLDGRPPDLVFEKLNNTFAHRHHLRVWQRPETFAATPLWAVAATHDIGINFSEQNRTFIHRIDSEIDRERGKVVNDLIFTGRVASLTLVERPQVPQKGQNATGDNFTTDGKIAVLVLK